MRATNLLFCKLFFRAVWMRLRAPEARPPGLRGVVVGEAVGQIRIYPNIDLINIY